MKMEDDVTFSTSTSSGQASAAQNGSSDPQNGSLISQNDSDLQNGLIGLHRGVGLESSSESENNSESEHDSTEESDSSTAAPQNNSSQIRVGIANDNQESAAAAAHEQKHVSADDLFPSEPQLKDVVPISSKEFENALEDALVCPVCYLPYNSQKRRPRMLGCGHTFCSFCINQIHKKDLFTFSLFHHISITCPVCRARHTFDSQKDIPLNRVVEDLLRVGNPPERDDNKEREDEVRGQSSNNTVSMTRKGMLLSGLFVALLAYCYYLWNENASSQINLDAVNNKFSTDLDIIQTKLIKCMVMNNADDQFGCLKEAFGKKTNNIDEGLNIKEVDKITDEEKYSKKKSVLMELIRKKDKRQKRFSPGLNKQFSKKLYKQKNVVFIPKEDDFFYKLSKSFNADNTHNENFFELMMSLDFTSPGQSGAWLWLEKGLTWMLQYFCMAHCIRYLCLYWWLRLSALCISGYLIWKTGEGIQAVFPIISGVGGSMLLLSMFTYMVYYVASGDNWISAWLYSEWSFAILQTNSLGGSILYGLAFILSILVVVVVWYMEGNPNRHNGVAVNAEVEAVAAAEEEEAAEAEAEVDAIDLAIEPAGQQDAPLDIAAAEPTWEHDSPIEFAAVANREEQDAANVDPASIPQPPEAQHKTTEASDDQEENGTTQNITESGTAADATEHVVATNCISENSADSSIS